MPIFTTAIIHSIPAVLIGAWKVRARLCWTQTLGLVLLTFASVVSSGARAQTLPLDAKATCTVSPAVFATWFQTGSVTANGVVNPANSVTFPDDPNCSFYQWSEQMFLWLNSPAALADGSSGRIFESTIFFDVSPLDAGATRTLIPHTPGQPNPYSLREAQVGRRGLPIIFDKAGRMLDVQRPRLGPNGMPLILNQSGQAVEVERIKLKPGGKPMFLDPAGRAIAHPKPMILNGLSKTTTVQRFMVGRIPLLIGSSGDVIDVDQGQAFDKGVLQAQNGSLVYYATLVNDVYAYFLTGTKGGGITPTPTQFPTTPDELMKINNFASSKGKTFSDANALAVELKTSWVEAAGLPNLDTYVTTTATIPTYDRSNPNKWVANGQKTVPLALVGMHVVGSTKGHPEMIWATFEHVGNSPPAEYLYDSVTGLKTVPQDTSGTWLFSASNSAGPFNFAHMVSTPPNVTAVPSQTVSPSDTIRWKSWGAASDSPPNPKTPATKANPLASLAEVIASSNSEIISINNSIRGMIPDGDVRKNYILTGATWTIGGAPPTNVPFPLPGNHVGTSRLSNTTMETYQQGTSSVALTGTNCFTCHSTEPASPPCTGMLCVSHVFGPLQPLAPKLTVNNVVVGGHGFFNLQIDGFNQATNAGNGGSTGPTTVDAGRHTVGEIAGFHTRIEDYNVTIGGDCSADGSIDMAFADVKTCVITNTKIPLDRCLQMCSDEFADCVEATGSPGKCRPAFASCRASCQQF
jgi:hypothetical protein